MSKYTEYRELVEKMDTVFEEPVLLEGGKKARIEFNPIQNTLCIMLPGDYRDGRIIDGRTGEALFQALKQLYE
jgi:hypothetical protein